MRDLPSGTALLALARELLLDALLPLAPPEKERQLHLLATAIQIAEREALAGKAPARDILERLRGFYGGSAAIADAAPAPHPNPLPASGEREGPARREGEGQSCADDMVLLRRFAADLRVGAFDACDRRGRAARALLWRLTILKLREGNPQFLAANGFGE